MVEPVQMQELLEHLPAEDIAGSSWGNCKACLVLLRVAPHQIAKGAIMWNLLKSLQGLNLRD